MTTSDLLLSEATFTEGDSNVQLERATCMYTPSKKQFHLKDKSFKTQYSHLYFSRLSTLREHVTKAAERQWGENVVIKKLVDVSVDEDVCIIGTMFKKMDMRPNILKEVSDVHRVVPMAPKKKYISNSDSLLLEDETQRISLVGNIPWESLVTGIVVAVKGKELVDGKFEVEDYCFAGLPQMANIQETSESNKDKYIVLLSGLNVGSNHSDQLSVEMMVDYLTGFCGAPEDQKQMSKVVRVVVAGNSITDKPAKIAMQDQKTKYLSRNYSAQSIEAVKELDAVLSQLSSCVPVDLMPGAHDPVNFTLPQQPFHKCMFPKASCQSTLRGVTNPHVDTIAGRVILGCSGQNVEDIYRCSKQMDRLSILEQTLRWRHIVPTAPDTLGSYPFPDSDPFIIEECPHIYFTGNQPSFRHKLIHNDGEPVLLVTVPDFDRTHSCVLVDLATLECTELKFSSGPAGLTEEVAKDEGFEEEENNQVEEEQTVNIMEQMMDDDADD